MIGQTIHNVKEFKVTDVRESQADDDTFYTRKIFVTDKKGNQIELIMFSDDRESLIPATCNQLGY